MRLLLPIAEPTSPVLLAAVALLASPLLVVILSALFFILGPVFRTMSQPRSTSHPLEMAVHTQADSGATETEGRGKGGAGGGAPPAGAGEEKDREKELREAKEEPRGGAGTGGAAAFSSPSEYEPRFIGVVPGVDDEGELSSRALEEVDTGPVMGEVYEVADVFYSTLCKRKSDAFAIGGKPEETPILICRKTDKVADVFKGMIQHNILSVPVLLDSGKYHGFLDMMDIVRWIVRHFGPTAFRQEKDFWELIREEAKFEEQTVADLLLVSPSRSTTFVPIVQGYSAFAAVELMAREITQSQCVRWLANHVDLLGSKKKEPVALVKHFFKEVISVREGDVALAAFELMVQKNIQGVAVVDGEGRLMGNLSLRDLKILGPDASMFWRLQQTVNNFLVKVRHDHAAREGGRRRHAIFVLPQATIKDVIVALRRYHIHRVYVVNDRKERKPVGVISLRDILLECIGV